jgi:hypothetical protein
MVIAISLFALELPPFPFQVPLVWEYGGLDFSSLLDKAPVSTDSGLPCLK